MTPPRPHRCFDGVCVANRTSCTEPTFIGLRPADASSLFPVADGTQMGLSDLSAATTVAIGGVTVPAGAFELATTGGAGGGGGGGANEGTISATTVPDSVLRSQAKPDEWDSVVSGIASVVVDIRVDDGVKRPFAKPVTVQLVVGEAFANVPRADLCLAFIDTRLGRWVCAGDAAAVTTPAGEPSMVSGEIDHFTTVAIVRRVADPLPPPGSGSGDGSGDNVGPGDGSGDKKETMKILGFAWYFVAAAGGGLLLIIGILVTLIVRVRRGAGSKKKPRRGAYGEMMPEIELEGQSVVTDIELDLGGDNAVEGSSHMVDEINMSASQILSSDRAF
jgi:hypothetical protein